MEEKRNEITPIPALLDLEGSVVIIDAVGTHTQIVADVLLHNETETDAVGHVKERPRSAGYPSERPEEEPMRRGR